VTTREPRLPAGTQVVLRRAAAGAGGRTVQQGSTGRVVADAADGRYEVVTGDGVAVTVRRADVDLRRAHQAQVALGALADGDESVLVTRHTVHAAVVGSRAFGLSTATSDTDTRVPCQTVLARFWRTMPGGVVVVAPAAQPAVEPPLGWTLSAASRIRLVTAMDGETATCRDPRTTGILGNYGRFGALLSWLRDRRECVGDVR
jgi:hypothetical protein